MTAVITSSPPVFTTIADVLTSVGDIPAKRVRVQPAPGTATETDLVRVNDDPFKTAICELVDGILVEKPMSSFESLLGGIILHLLNAHVLPRKLGAVLGEQGMLRLAPGLVRIPDVSFISRGQFPGGKVPRDPIWEFHPDLAVEVLSPSNTPREMDRKLRDYFTSGTQLVWYLDPETEEMRVYRSEAEFEVIGIDGTVDGGDLLPGFSMSMKELFKMARMEVD